MSSKAVSVRRNDLVQVAAFGITVMSTAAALVGAVGVAFTPDDSCDGQLAPGGGARFSLQNATAYAAVISVASLAFAVVVALRASSEALRLSYSFVVLFFSSFWFTAAIRSGFGCGNLYGVALAVISWVHAVFLTLGASRGFA